MNVLKHMTYIEDKYLRYEKRAVPLLLAASYILPYSCHSRVLVRDKELYADCDIVIKRHLWRDNQSLFGDEVSPFLSQYIKEKEQVLYSHENNPGFFSVSRLFS